MEQIDTLLNNAKKELYAKSGLVISKIVLHDTNREYNACEFKINKKNICFRSGKLTPTKLGHFVSLWKYIDNVNSPYSSEDNYAFYIFDVRDDDNYGQFIFPMNILVEQKILSNDGKKGKLGFRLYAPWYDLDSATAKKTQSWQTKYFYDSNNLPKNIK